MRVVTSSEVVKFHLKNFLKYAPKDYEIVVVGTDVRCHSSQYSSNIKWINLNIERKIRPFKDLISLFKLIQIVRSEKVDVLHSIMPKSGLLASLAGFATKTPIRIHTFTGQVWATRRNPMRFFLKSIDKLIVFVNTQCLTDSFSQSDFLNKNGINWQGKPLPVLGFGSLDGIDLAVFDPELRIQLRKKFRTQLGISDSSFVFIYLGRKNRDKGVQFIVEAFLKIRELHPDCYLLYVGPSEDDDVLRAHPQIDLKNIVVVDRTITPENYIYASDVFCLPSQREGFGTSVIECAAAGVPTIGSRIPGLIDSIVDQKTGLLLDQISTESLFNCMLNLYQDRRLLQSLSVNCPDFVIKKFDAQLVIRNTFLLYKELLGQQIDQTSAK